MIKVDKAPIADLPLAFVTKGEFRTLKHCEFYDNPPPKYVSGEIPFPKVVRSIYQLAKDKLVESYGYKCCYCEKKYKYKGDLDVEHFRPSRFSKQTKTSAEIPLVYFWLAYEWDNLLLSCGTCNRTYKGNQFPLENPKARATAKARNIANERPSFIDPSTENPRSHITFVNETPASDCRRGKRTIQGLGLRRKQLFEDRLEHLDKIRAYLKDVEMCFEFEELVREEGLAGARAMRLLSDHREKRLKAILFLTDAQNKDAPFSSMVQDFLSQHSIDEL